MRLRRELLGVLQECLVTSRPGSSLREQESEVRCGVPLLGESALLLRQSLARFPIEAPLFPQLAWPFSFCRSEYP